MARALIVVKDQGFHSDEIKTLKDVLKRKGHDVSIVSTARSRILSRDGVSFMPDFAIYEVNPDYFDVLLIVGENARKLAAISELIFLIRRMASMRKIIVATGSGSLVLAAAGIMNGRRAAVMEDGEIVKRLKEYNVAYVEREIVWDENILTGKDRESSEEVAREIVKLLSE